MNILYLDATAGIAGDMTVATLLDLGLPFDYLQQELTRLGLPEGSYRLETGQVTRRGMTGRSFVVRLPDKHPNHHHAHDHHHHHHRSYADIRQLIAESSLADRVKELAQRIFLRLAEAEAVAHQVVVDAVMFHEVGAVDSIVDIVGTAIGQAYLEIDKIYCSAVPLGGGFVETAHGRLPVPAPATALLMKGLCVHGNCGTGERVTPTGAAILAALAEPLPCMPVMKIESIGHGAGSKDFEDCPNILRGFLGEVDEQGTDTVLELSCNLDDVTPEVVGYVVQRLLATGALDVWTTPVQMKKQRPGVQLSLLCRPVSQQICAEILMCETGTLGVRCQPVQRLLQQREVVERQTRWGLVRFKVSHYGAKPEYDDCRRISHAYEIPLREVQRLLLKEYDDA